MNATQDGKPIVHLVGSMPLKDTETVFRTVCAKIGPDIIRLPDGETGKRSRWISLLEKMMAAHPAMAVDEDLEPREWRQWDGQLVRVITLFKFKDDADLDKIVLDTGYADAAIESFAIFDRLQSAGVIPAGVKFQVCLPTPLAPVYNFVSPRAHERFLAIYEPAILGEVARIAGELPNERWSLQWDVCQEVLVYEDHYDYRPDDYKEQVCAQLGRIGNAVPEAIEFGYHLCYGSPLDEHLVQPKDMAVMVEMTNDFTQRVTRPVQFIHMPVPKERDDDAYFKPLDGLELPPGTDLYLGLSHYDDHDGDRRRLAAARAHARVAGVSSECGWGRTDPARLPSLLDSLHRISTS